MKYEKQTIEIEEVQVLTGLNSTDEVILTLNLPASLVAFPNEKPTAKVTVSKGNGKSYALQNFKECKITIVNCETGQREVI